MFPYLHSDLFMLFSFFCFVFRVFAKVGAKMASTAGGTMQALRGVSSAFYRFPSSRVVKAIASLDVATIPSISGTFGTATSWKKVENANWRRQGLRCMASAASTAANNLVVSENYVAVSSPSTGSKIYILHLDFSALFPKIDLRLLNFAAHRIWFTWRLDYSFLVCYSLLSSAFNIFSFKRSIVSIFVYH